MPEYTLPNVVVTIALDQLHQALLVVVPSLTNLSYDEPTQTLTAVTSETITTQQQQDAVALVNNQPVSWQSIAQGAEQAVADIPSWAHWNITQALEWHDTNVQLPVVELQADITAIANLAGAKVVLEDMRLVMDKIETENRAIVEMIIAIRNKLWPHLQNGQ